MPAKDEIPSTLQRSPEHAQEIFEKTLDSANETYGPGERAHRTAFAAVKHEYEKVGDHWEEKESSGPSDSGAAGSSGSRSSGSASSGKTQGGVDANASKAHLMDVAKRLDVSGRSKMNKDELVEAIGKANDRATAAARK
jgi:cation transport regulator ChaB